MSAIDSGNALATRASPETIAQHMLPIKARITTLQGMQATWLGGSECTTMHVKHESKNVLQVQNRTVCFMLATEAPSDPLARMRLPGDLWPELLNHMSSASLCSTFHHLRARLVFQSVKNMSIITRSRSASMCEQTISATKAEQGTRHKDRFFVTSTPEAQTRRLPRLPFRQSLTSAS